MNTPSALHSSSVETLQKCTFFKLKYMFRLVINFLLGFVFYFVMRSLIYDKEKLQKNVKVASSAGNPGYF